MYASVRSVLRDCRRMVDCPIGTGVASVYMTPYVEPRDVCSFEHVSLYSG